MPVAEITTADIVRVMSPIWARGRLDGAKRLLSRISATLDYATANGLREGDNPASRAILKHLEPAAPGGPRKRHAAINWRALPDLVRRLRIINSTAARALEMLALTACRSAEIRAARWGEIDLTAAVLTVPASRMKGKAAHSVPLSLQAIDILRRMQVISTSDLIFEGTRKGRAVHSETVRTLMADLTGATVHGLRSSFRDWCGETGVSRELAELSLAHKFGNETEASYARSSLLERRRAIMAQWAHFLDGKDGAEVIPLARPWP
jgi:integrase